MKVDLANFFTGLIKVKCSPASANAILEATENSLKQYKI